MMNKVEICGIDTSRLPVLKEKEKAALQKELAQIKGSRFYKMKTKYDSFMKR